MKKLKINKKTITIATYTIAILSAISFAIYPETNAIFKKDNEKALAYTSSLDNTYTGSFRPVLNRDASTLNTARIILTLPRDTRYITESEKYTIEAISSTPLNTETPETTCSIIPNTKSGNIRIDEENNIIFTNNENGVIEIECNVEANKIYNEDIKVLVKYYEQVLGDEERFLFQEGTFSMDYSEYADPYSEPPADSIILIENEDGSEKTSEKIYEEFVALVEKNKSENEYGSKVSRELFIEYINDNNITEITAKDVLILAKEFNLLGVTRTPSKNSDGSIRGYGFEFDENFVGYVKTHSFYKKDFQDGGNFIFFSSNNPEKIELAFKNSVDKWAFEDDNRNFTIGTETYTSKSLIMKYVDDCLKENNLDYLTLLNDASKIPGVYNGIQAGPIEGDIDDYKYTAFRPTIFDYAYNYLSIDNATIRVSYYEDLSSEVATSYIKTISRAGVLNLFNNYIIEADLTNLLRHDLNTASTDLYKSVMCKENCSDYIEIYYTNNKYYKVKVNHNETEKYNEIKITESDTFEVIAAGEYDTNVVAGIQSNLNSEESLLNSAITCKSNCTEYNEVHYNGAKGEYLLVNITPNTTYNVNKITITKKASFINAIENVYSAELIESISVGLSDQILDSAITCTGADCSDYYEIHYDKDTQNYMLIKVSSDTDNNYNIVNIINLKSVSDTSIDESAIKNLKSAYIYLKENDIDIEETLIKYLDATLNGVYASMGSSPNNALYSYGYYIVLSN